MQNETPQKFTVFKNHSEPVFEVTLAKIIEVIVRGTFKTQVENVRRLLAEGKSKEAQQTKMSLDAVTFAGVFSTRRKEEFLTSYSQIIVLDFDKLDGDILKNSIAQVQKIEYTHCCFISPSGKGIKILVKINSFSEHHKIAFDQVASYYENLLNLKADRSGSDITRLCYVSFDPKLYFNEESAVFHVKTITCDSQPNIAQSNNSIASVEKYKYAVKFTERVAKFEEGKRNNFVYSLAFECKKLEIDIEEAKGFILHDFGYDRHEIENTIKSAYKRNIETFDKTKQSVFSINYLTSMRFKPKSKIDERVLFEVILIKHLKYRKPFYYSRAAIQKELGINKDRVKTIINKFREIGFLRTSIQRSLMDGRPRQVTYFEVIPEKVSDAIDELMVSGDELKNKLLPLLKSNQSIDIGYSYQE